MIHKLASVSPKAKIAADAAIGPFAVIGDHVTIGSGTEVGPHVVIEGRTEIGQKNRISAGAVIGLEPQDKKFKGEPLLKIGDQNVIREYATIHGGASEHGTVIGNENYIMAYCHIAHDCHLNDGIVMANAAMLSGHVWVGNKAFISGFVGVHQFARIGEYTMIGGHSRVSLDILPYSLCQGEPLSVIGANSVGLKRAGFTDKQILDIKSTLRTLLYSDKLFKDALEVVRKEAKSPEARRILQFIDESKRGITCRS